MLDTASLFSLDGRIALVTGGSRGIGRMIAEGFLAQGARVYISARKADQCDAAAREMGPNCFALPADVSTVEGAQALAATFTAREPALDILVNNAGAAWGSDFETFPEAGWDKVFNINVKAPFFVTRAAVPLLRKGANAAVVNVSSVAGLAGMGSSIAYCASKGALNTMTKSLARVLAPEIRVNAVCPGPIDTRWLRTWMNEEQIQAFVADYPIPRCATPDDIADTIYYLARGTSLTTGQLLVVDGGRVM